MNTTSMARDGKGNADAATVKSRRGFMRSAGFGAAGLAGAALGTMGAGLGGAKADTDIDVAILQFALNLEYLEAEFYLRAANGQGLSPMDTGPNGGMVTGGSMVPFTSPLIAAYAREIAIEEQKHVRFLRAALKAVKADIPEPAIDLKSSFQALGQDAGLGDNFNPFADEMQFLLGAYVFEDVGVTAYHGAASLITSKDYLDKAAGILAVEAYHAGLIRTVLFANNMTAPPRNLQSSRRTRRHGRHDQYRRSWRGH